jgi:hypothetical protein
MPLSFLPDLDSDTAPATMVLVQVELLSPLSIQPLNTSQPNGHLSSLKVGANGISNHLAAPSPSRLVMSGHCTATAVIGQVSYRCACLHGEYDAPLSTLDVICKVCTHPLSQHEDADSSTAQGSSFQFQSMSPSSFS